MAAITLKRILVPTDFSDPSDVALRYAVSLAETFGAHLHLLHVVERPIEQQWAAELAMVAAIDVEAEARAKSDTALSQLLTKVERERFAARFVDSDGRAVRRDRALRAAGEHRPHRDGHARASGARPPADRQRRRERRAQGSVSGADRARRRARLRETVTQRTGVSSVLRPHADRRPSAVGSPWRCPRPDRLAAAWPSPRSSRRRHRRVDHGRWRARRRLSPVTDLREEPWSPRTPERPCARIAAAPSGDAIAVTWMTPFASRPPATTPPAARGAPASTCRRALRPDVAVDTGECVRRVPWSRFLESSGGTPATSRRPDDLHGGGCRNRVGWAVCVVVQTSRSMFGSSAPAWARDPASSACQPRSTPSRSSRAAGRRRRCGSSSPGRSARWSRTPTCRRHGCGSRRARGPSAR